MWNQAEETNDEVHVADGRVAPSQHVVSPVAEGVQLLQHRLGQRSRTQLVIQ